MDTVISPHALPSSEHRLLAEASRNGCVGPLVVVRFAGEYLKYVSIATVDDRNAVAEAVRRSVLALEKVAKAGGR